MSTLRHLLAVLVRDPVRSGALLATARRLPRFLAEWRSYRKASAAPVPAAGLNPQLFDRTETTPFDPHYFYQSAWAAACIAANRPARHVDVGSQINFIAPLTAFVPVEFVDIRPLEATLEGLVSRKGSVLSLPYADGSVESISCLHVIEHIGLGRYGDPLDPLGSLKACRELERVLAPDGHLYLSLPVGRERVEFNAHRVHDPATVLAGFPGCELASFAYVDDAGAYHPKGRPEQCRGLRYGCGMFDLVRRRSDP